MIYLIIGRFASGKHYLADILKENLPAEPTNNADVIDALCDGDIVVQNNIIITSPERFSNIAEADPDEAFAIIHVEADTIKRKCNYVKTYENKLKGENEFNNASDAEDTSQTDFELMMHDILHTNSSTASLPSNITRCYHYVNDFTPETAVTNADNIVKDDLLNRKIAEIIAELHAQGLVQGKTDSDRLAVSGNKLVSPSYFSELIVNDDTSFANIMKMWLMVKDKDLKPNTTIINAVHDHVKGE